MEGKVLIVDDDQYFRETLADILQAKGYTVTLAADGFEAVGKVQESAFDCILMDVRMPTRDGVETFRELKKIRPGARVVMMTAHAMEDLAQESLREGALEIVLKPLDIERVVDLIEKPR